MDVNYWVLCFILNLNGAWSLTSTGALSNALARGVVGGLTSGLAALSTENGKPSKARDRTYESISLDMLMEGIRRDIVENEYLWTGQISTELYDEDCVFSDPTLTFEGLSTFERNIALLDPLLERWLQSKRVYLRDLRQVDGIVEAKWRMDGRFALPWRPRLRLDGSTRFVPGPDGRVVTYDERWENLSALGALLTVLTPEKEGPPLTDLRQSSVLVLPGFGNDARDYELPFGNSEASLKSGLERRSAKKVSILPVQRVDWLRVFYQADLPFLSGRADWQTSAYAWYLDRCRAVLEQQPDPVLIIGHSAGGWLARALLRKYSHLESRVAAVATLGTPHFPPRDDPTSCVTRGVLSALERADEHDPPRVPFVTVVGDAFPATSSAVQASYIRVTGARATSDVFGISGDGVVPETYAHLPYSYRQITLDSSLHSINVPGTLEPTDSWYGSEAYLDGWLPTLLEAAQSRLAKL